MSLNLQNFRIRAELCTLSETIPEGNSIDLVHW